MGPEAKFGGAGRGVKLGKNHVAAATSGAEQPHGQMAFLPHKGGVELSSKG